MNTPNSKLAETVSAILEERAEYHQQLAEKAVNSAYRTHDQTIIDSKMAEAHYHIGEVERNLAAAENLREAGEK